MPDTRRIARYCHDWEFLETGHDIAPISVGIVAEDGREYYAVFDDIDMQAVAAHPFLKAEVMPYLPTYYDGRRGYWRLEAHRNVKSRELIRAEIHAFLIEPELPVELWAYYSAHDHVCLAGLWGPMAELGRNAPGIPWFTRDIKSEAVRLGNPQLPAQTDRVHHALADARHDWVRLRHLERLEESRGRELQGLVDGICPACKASGEVAWQHPDDPGCSRVTCRACGWDGWDEQVYAETVGASA